MQFVVVLDAGTEGVLEYFGQDVFKVYGYISSACLDRVHIL